MDTATAGAFVGKAVDVLKKLLQHEAHFDTRSAVVAINGPARALMRCLLGGWIAMGQLDGLASTIRFRLSSRPCEGAWAGPDAATVGVCSQA